MTTLTNHTLTLANRSGNRITAPVVHVKDLGDGHGDVHIETNYHLEDGHDFPATYRVPGALAVGTYRIHAKTWTASQTYIYMGIFTRT